MAIADTTAHRYSSTMSGAPSLSTSAGSFIGLMDAIIAGFGSVNLSSLSVSSDIATATFNTAHGFAMTGSVGPVITISGASPSDLNGDWRIATVPSTLSFTFVTSGISNQTATGTISAKIAGAKITKEYSGTNKAVYRFQTGNCRPYYRIDNTVAGNTFTVKLYNAMTDIDTGTGGSSAFTVYQYYSNPNPPWKVFCDTGIAHVFLDVAAAGAWSGSGHLGTIVPQSESVDGYYGVLVGNQQLMPTGSATGVIQRSYTQLGDPVTFSRQAFPRNFLAYPDPLVTFSCSPVLCFEGTGTAYRGTFPGLYLSSHLISGHPATGTTINIGNRVYEIQVTHDSGINTVYYAMDITGPWR